MPRTPHIWTKDGSVSFAASTDGEGAPQLAHDMPHTRGFYQHTWHMPACAVFRVVMGMIQRQDRLLSARIIVSARAPVSVPLCPPLLKQTQPF